MNKNIKLFTIIITGIILIFILGLSFNKNITPKDVYQVYLDGQVIGLIESKEELENYINKEQQTLKEKYKVDKVYAPVGLEVKRHITYKDNISNTVDIYEQIKNKKPFTIKGYIFTIKDKENTNKVYALNQEIFKKSLEKTLKAFIKSDEYEAYINDTQVEIKTTGKRIESISLKEEITVREDLISTNEIIFTDEVNLSKYMLFGTLDSQQQYTVKADDTIESVAYQNNLSPEEFLVANSEFTSVNNLLYPGQVVSIGLIKPKIKVEVIEHVVEDKQSNFKTEIIYDQNILVGNSYVKVQGENGLVRSTSKLEIVNGKIESALPVDSIELKPTINQVVVKGGKVIANVGDSSYWAWPTRTPYVISSYFGPRWGSFHDAIDISGTGYGSPIYATNNGTVVKSDYTSVNGNYIIINHNNGYYTFYGHMSQLYAKEGQVVSRGQVIGAMGNSGVATGTHVHYAIWRGYPYRGGVALNPLNFY